MIFAAGIRAVPVTKIIMEEAAMTYVRHLIAPSTLAELIFGLIFLGCVGLLLVGFGG